MAFLTTGIVGTSNKENEDRLPIHPRHLERIPEALRPHLRFEQGYGARFSLRDADLAPYCGGLLPRAELLATCDCTILPKPLPEDLAQIREGAVLWGWPHCVQQCEITQVAIDRRLTLVAFEAMFQWTRGGGRGLHIFARNNELAGYCSVLHALELLGMDGHYGPPRRAAVLGFGSVSHGAIYALQGRGYHDIDVYTLRRPHLVRGQVFGCNYWQMRRGVKTRRMKAAFPDGSSKALAEVLAQADILVNGALQDPEDPLMYFTEGETGSLRPGTLIIDVSCDLGMGFPFARPTSFEEPILRVGEVTYYGVDHSPSYLWDAATWEISTSLLPYLEAVMEGPAGWEREATLGRAVEIREGVVKNPMILSFQSREAAYPHACK